MNDRRRYFLAPAIRLAAATLLSVWFATYGADTFTSYAHTKEESIYISGNWVKDDAGWRYFNQWNSKYPAGQWIEYQGHSYYFMDNGYMATGWRYLNNHWYYFNTEEGSTQGAMVTGWIRDSNYNSTFYTNQIGIMVIGWHKIDASWYYFNPGPDAVVGQMAVSRVIEGSYVNADGKMNEER
jgi:sialidase-1